MKNSTPRILLTGVGILVRKLPLPRYADEDGHIQISFLPSTETFHTSCGTQITSSLYLPSPDISCILVEFINLPYGGFKDSITN
jgi:hypothetical protein